MIVRPIARRRGFSLIEIVVTLAIVALVAGLMVMNIGAIIQGLGTRPLPETLHDAVQEARYQAAATKQTVFLRFDPETATFRIAGENGEELGTIDTGYDPDDRDVEVVFEQILPARGLSGLGRQEQVEIPYVRFHPDRSSTPFVAHLRYDDESSTHRYDPFSDLELSRTE